MDTWILQMCRRSCTRQLLAWGVAVAAALFFAALNTRYINNFLNGPLPMGTAEAPKGEVHMRSLSITAICVLLIASMPPTVASSEAPKTASVVLGNGSLLNMTPKEEIPSDTPASVREKVLALYSASPFARFEAARSLGQMGRRAVSAVPQLIDLLADQTLAKMVSPSGSVETKVQAQGQFFLFCSGECFFVDSEAEKALRGITGQDFGKEQKKWRSWWERNRRQRLNRPAR